ncbi:MAG: hypothetical protein HFI10_13660 [Lachnospiraceae bacterium]|jgi:uncharacterized protein with FMN-binding domain|nr:hypothetical protein [Lachnospiraceae bacterium]
MSSKTKIVVLHLKELIYTGIFVVLGILFIILLFIMFRSDKDAAPAEQQTTPDTETGTEPPDSGQTPIYQPGAYRSALYLENETVEINLTVDETRIVSLTMVPPSDKISTLYPLLEPSFRSISEQICENQSLEDITYADEAAYTSELILEVIGDTLAKVKTPPEQKTTE